MPSAADPTISAAALRPRIGEPGLLLVDVRDEARFREATIPGAVSLNVYDYFIPASTPAGDAGLNADNGVADLAAAACAALRTIGADQARTTVYFEDQTGMISPRGLWFHEFARLSGGLILDGGMQSWAGDLAPGQGPANSVHSGAAMPAGWSVDRSKLATVDDVLARDPARSVLLDVRRRSEHDGSFVHPCCARPGRIPGSTFLFWEDLLENGHYRAAPDIAARAAGAGLSPDQEIITYCHRGARAATALFGLRRAGFPHGRVFVGSWHEWAERSDLPAETGVA